MTAPGRESGAPELPPALKSRILAAAAQQPSASRRELSGRNRLLFGSALLVPLLLFLLAGGARIGPRPFSLATFTALGALANAACAVFVALGRGDSMLGRPRPWLIGAALLAPLAFLAWKVSFSAGVPHMMDAWATRPGYRCFALTAALATWPFFVMAWVRRQSDPAHPRALGLALGVAAGAAAATLVDLWCPVGHVRHLVAGHVGPMLMFGVVGALLGQRVLAPRAR